MPGLKRKIHDHKPDIACESAIPIINSTVLGNNSKDVVTNKEGATVYCSI
jgi:hypothetical protein